MTPPSTHIPSETAVKLMIIGRRNPATTLVEHRQHIRHVHGEMVLQYIAQDPRIAPRRYAQNAVFDGTYRRTVPGLLPANDPLALNRDFVTQIWFPSLQAAGASLQTDFYKNNLKADEDNFVDQASVVFTSATEREVISRSTPALNVFKLFYFIQKSTGVSTEAFNAAWREATGGLHNWSGVEQVQRYVQNDMNSGPQGPCPVDGIDEFWVSDEASARALHKIWNAHIKARLVDRGLAKADASFALFATEQVLFAGATA